MRWASRDDGVESCETFEALLCSSFISRSSIFDSTRVQLREIVPPPALHGGLENGDSKRPKHTVLSDTIALVKQLQCQV